MKLAVPTLGAAFGGQLADANIPLASLSRSVVPIVVMVLAAALLAKGGGSKSLDLAASCTAADKRSPGC